MKGKKIIKRYFSKSFLRWEFWQFYLFLKRSVVFFFRFLKKKIRRKINVLRFYLIIAKDEILYWLWNNLGRSDLQRLIENWKLKIKEMERIEFPVFFSLAGWQPRLALVRVRKAVLWPFKKHWQEVFSFILIGLIITGVLYIQKNQEIIAANFSGDHKWSWGENIGWNNFQPTHGGVTVESAGLTGYVWAENVGWIKLDYDGVAGAENTSATNWGVTNDGSGNLAGYGWGENIGWVNFNPTHSQVIIGGDGSFSGYAWSENAGWIKFDHTQTNYTPKTTWNQPIFDQKHFQIYNDDGTNLNDATAFNGVAEDTNTNVPIDTNFRIRFQVANTGTGAGDIIRRLQFNEDSAGWTQCTTSTNNVILQDTPNFLDGDATTSRLTATGTFTAGQGKDTGSDTSEISLTNAYYIEDEFSLKFQAAAATKSYQFRIYNTATTSTLDVYTATPTIVAITTPTVTTSAASSVASTSATGNGNITATGGENATQRGVEWGTTDGGPYPNSATDTGSYGTGAFTKNMTGLSAATTYYYRAKAYNTAGWGYGSEQSFLTTPAAPTGVSATDGTYTDKVTVTWNASTGATGYKVYDSVSAGWTDVSNVLTWDHTAASAPTITPGTSVATDGTEANHIALSLSGTSANVGANVTYKVLAYNATGDGPESATDTGYRGVGSLTYQWQRSAADSDLTYSNITGATSATYNDTDAPAYMVNAPTSVSVAAQSTSVLRITFSGASVTAGAGRYYKCVLNATGASQQTSTADRGYRDDTIAATNGYEVFSDTEAGGTYSTSEGTTSSSPFDDTLLSANTRKYYKVKSMSTAGTWSSLSSAYDGKYTLANQVTSLTAADATTKTTYQINLSWTNQGQSGVKIEQDTNCDGYETTVYDNASTTPSTPYTVSVSANTCYKFRVSSYNGDGVINSTSIPETSQITSPPAQPTGLTHTANTLSTITWDWNDVTGATGYKVYRSSDDVLLQTIATATSSWTQDSLSANTQYSVYVRATNANGEGIASSSASAYTSANTPTNAGHSTNTTTSVTWTWQSGGAQKDYYAWTTTPVDNSGWILTTSWAQSSLSANTQYTCYVKARNEDLDETGSASASACASQNTPTGISFDAISFSSITLSAEGTFPNLTSGSSGLYFLNTTNSDTPGWTQTNSWTNSTLSANTQYTYQVKARNCDIDETSYSATSSKYTAANTPVAGDATSITSTSLRFNWSSGGSQTDYAYGTTSDCLDGTTANTYLDLSTLTAGTQYTRYVCARNGDTTKTSSITLSEYTLPGDPSGLATASPTASSLALSWTKGTNGDKTKIMRKTSSYPTSESDGTQVYFDTASSTTDTTVSASTTYYYRAWAYDSDSGYYSSSYSEATGTTLVSMTTSAASAITQTTATLNGSITVGDVSALEKGFDWGTSDSYGYSWSETGTFSTGSFSYGITGLTAGVTYHFRAKARNSAGWGYGSDTAFNSSCADVTGPVISNVSYNVISDTKVAVLWQTDELATSQVEYGLTDAYGTETTEDTTLTIQHGEEITGLTTNTTYHFRVKSKDSSNNPTTSSDYTFSTQVTATTTIIRRVIDPDAPIISNIQVKEIKQDSAKISWTTSEDANTLVAYGQTSQYGLLAGDISAATSNHNVALTNLTQGTTYHYKIYAYDSSGNKGYSDEKTFKTLKEGEVAPPTEEEVPAEEEVTPTEEEEQRSILERIKTASRGFFARIWETLPLNPNLLGISETIFVGSVSEMASRVITPPVIIAGFPRVEELEPTRVKVVWVTDKESNSILTLASDVDYDPTKDQPYPIIMGNPDEEVLNHEVQIIGLEAQTLYHYEVRSRSKYGEWAKSGDRIFTTLSMTAEIFDIKFMEIAEESVKLTWKTTIPTRSNFEITDLSTGEKAAQEDPSYLKDHEFVITSLTASTNYTVQIFADDEIGNRSSSPVLPFTTTLSLEPPEISQVRIITSIIPGKVEKIQAIISWKTDKPATSKIYYEEGITTHKDLVLTTPLDKELVKDHTVITTAFKPGKAYRLRIESTDASGNASYSKDYTILTPRPRESILDLIIKNFEEIFGFLRQMKF